MFSCVAVKKEDMDTGTKRKNTLLIISPTVSQQTLNTEAKRKKATITDRKKRGSSSGRAVLTTFQELI